MRRRSLSARSPGPTIGRVGFAFLLLVVIAAGVGSDAGGGDATVPRWLGLAVIGVASAAALAGLLFAFWSGGQAAFADTGWREKAVAAGIAAVALAGIVMIFVLPRWERDGPWIFAQPGRVCVDPVFWWMHYPSRRVEIDRDPERFCPWPSGGVEAGGAGGGGGGEISRTLVAVAGGAFLAAILIVVAAAIAARWRRRRSPTPEEDTAVLQALDESLDDLRREQDVRRAIVACYARMERALAVAGRARREHEAPLEFLTRVLERVAREPGHVLTELFERARFSVEPMGEQDKRKAIAALETLRAEVAAG